MKLLCSFLLLAQKKRTKENGTFDEEFFSKAENHAQNSASPAFGSFLDPCLPAGISELLWHIF